MSGGSYDYAYCRVNDMAHTILARLDAPPEPGEPEPGQWYLHDQRRWVDFQDPEAVAVRTKIAVFRRAFATHLLLVSDAMRAVEWVDSGDSSEGAEVAAIEAVVGDYYRGWS